MITIIAQIYIILGLFTVLFILAHSMVVKFDVDFGSLLVTFCAFPVFWYKLFRQLSAGRK